MPIALQPISIRSKVAALLFVGALLYCGALWIHGLAGTREASRQSAARELLKSRPNSQLVQGVVLSYSYQHSVTSENGSTREETLRFYSVPQSLQVTGALTVTPLARGIFTFPSSDTQWQLKALFATPKTPDSLPADSLRLVKRELLLGAGPTGAMLSKISATFGGHTLIFRPSKQSAIFDAYVAPLPEGLEISSEQSFDISFALGALSSSVVRAVAGEIQLNLSSPWPHPSFQGRLPDRREINSKGFTAHWQRADPQVDSERLLLADEYRMQMESTPSMETLILAPIDAYRKIFRALEYSLLLIGLLFGSCILCELLGKLRVHPAQYFLVGAALILFYLLLLSLSEHLAFGIAYSAAALTATCMIAGYMKGAFGARFGALFGCSLCSIYLYLYFVLAAEDFALLSGSIALVALLAACMFATRKLDWYALFGNAGPSYVKATPSAGADKGLEQF